MFIEDVDEYSASFAKFDEKSVKALGKRIIKKYITSTIRFNIGISEDTKNELINNDVVFSNTVFSRAKTEVHTILKERYYHFFLSSEYFLETQHFYNWYKEYLSLPNYYKNSVHDYMMLLYSFFYNKNRTKGYLNAFIDSYATSVFNKSKFNIPSSFKETK